MLEAIREVKVILALMGLLLLGSLMVTQGYFSVLELDNYIQVEN